MKINLKEEDKLIGLMRIKNEAGIIEDTLNHMQKFCKYVYIYDDDSTDDTYKICKKHPVVAEIISETKWNNNQEYVQSEQRKCLLDYAKYREPTESHFIYMDADERITNYDFKDCKKYDVIVMDLFNAVMTPEDKHDLEGQKLKRKYYDPAARQIPFIFHRIAIYHGGIKCERYPRLPQPPPGVQPNVIKKGLVQHFGRAISQKEWDKTCDHYIANVPVLSEKWKKEKEKGPIRKDIENLKTWKEIETYANSVLLQV